MGGYKLEGTGEIIVITDANILIDYAKADKKIIKLLVRLFKEVRVPFEIMKEVNGLSVSQAESFGVVVYYSEPDIYYRAANADNGISFQDNICFLDADKFGWSLVTNDRQLRQECEKVSVSVFWGLQVLIIMVKEKLLTRRDALKAGEKIYNDNPRITREILGDFKKKIK